MRKMTVVLIIIRVLGTDPISTEKKFQCRCPMLNQKHLNDKITETFENSEVLEY